MSSQGQRDRYSKSFTDWTLIKEENRSIQRSSAIAPPEHTRIMPYRHQLVSGPEFSFGKRHMKSMSSIGPGPGAYSVSSRLNRGPTASLKGSHVTLKRMIDDNPSPGQYNVKPIRSSGAVSIKGRFSEKESITSPGPCHYSIRGNVSNNNRAAIIQGRPGHGVRCYKDYDTPGPGTYSTVTAGIAIGKSAPSATITSRHKDLSLKGSFGPGPGSYSLYNRKGRLPAFSIKGRSDRATALTSPGPASYLINTTQRGPSFTFGGRQTEIRTTRNNGTSPMDGYDRTSSVRGRLQTTVNHSFSPGPTYKPIVTRFGAPSYMGRLQYPLLL